MKAVVVISLLITALMITAAQIRILIRQLGEARTARDTARSERDAAIVQAQAAKADAENARAERDRALKQLADLSDPQLEEEVTAAITAELPGGE